MKSDAAVVNDPEDARIRPTSTAFVATKFVSYTGGMTIRA
jgi:hypothetical protein